MQRNYLRCWLAVVGGLGLGLATPTSALAQTSDPEPAVEAPDSQPQPAASQPPSDSGIEEIVVQGAESEAVRDFEAADSVTGFGAEDLAALGAQDIADLAAFTPNLEIVTSGATTPTFFIRGVGLNDFNSNSTGAVSIYQDDVARNAPALQLSTLFDIEAVNVLRGPQGTGLARNSSAGAIKIYSRKPSGNFGGFLRSELGNYNLRDFEGALEAPIYEDMVAGRFAFRFTQRDGTMRNRCGNGPTDAEKTIIPPSGTIPGNPPGLNDLGLTNRDAPYSVCGEPVAFVGQAFDPSTWSGISPIPAGLAPWVNDVNNWAGRGTLLFQPTLDMSWLLNAHGSRRNELSRLGQSIGVGGPDGFTCLNGDVENCFPQDSNQDARIDFLLGAQQGVIDPGYQAPEIRARWEELAPCFIGIPRMGNMPGRPDGTCRLNRINGQPNTEAKRSADAAKKQVALELANGLDSEPWAGDFNRTGPTQNDVWGTYLKGDIALPGGMQLASVTAFDTYDRVIDIDLDFSPETLFQILTEDQGWQVYQDIRLEGQLGDEYPLRWDIGAWFLRENLDVLVTNDLGIAAAFGVGTRDYTQDLWSSAGYASLGIDLGENFTLDGGFRYNWEQKKLDYLLQFEGGQADITEKLDTSWTAPTGTVRLTYRFREDTHVFWKYTRGWKPGTFNATSSPGQGVSTAEPETIDAFETGVRGSWLEGRVGLDFSFFYYAYENYQLFTAQQFANGQPEFVILNAPSAEVYGAELDLVTRPWIGAFINARIGWLESQFLEFTQVQQTSEFQFGRQQIVNREIQNAGNPLLNSPRFKISLTGEQTLPLGRWGSLTARYDGVWTDVTYFDASKGLGLPNNQGIQFYPENTIAQPSYWLHNVRLSYRLPGGQVEIAGFVRNIENKAYKTFAFDGSTFNNTSIYFVGDPRTFGGTLTINF